MARSYGHIMSAIWNDPEFRALDGAAQRMYLLLVTQADISSAGTLPMTLKRWSGYATDTPSDALSDALSRLQGKRFIAYDEDTEELVVRSFVKWDGGAGNEKRRPAITAAANATASPRIRAVLRVELDKLRVPHALSDSQPDTPRVVVTEVSTSHNPIPQPEAATLVPAPMPPSGIERGGSSQAIIGRWIEHCRQRPPERVIGPVSKHVKELLAEGIDPAHVERGLAQWAGKGLNPAALPSVVNEVMNARPGRPATTDSRAAEALALSERLRASGE